MWAHAAKLDEVLFDGWTLSGCRQLGFTIKESNLFCWYRDASDFSVRM